MNSSITPQGLKPQIRVFFFSFALSYLRNGRKMTKKGSDEAPCGWWLEERKLMASGEGEEEEGG